MSCHQKNSTWLSPFIWLTPILMLVFAVSFAALGFAEEEANATPTAAEEIEAEGHLSVSDGSSVYTFMKDGTFKLEPLGMSGRTIEGTWVQTDSIFVITGTWGWVNGLSKIDDRREMKVYVVLHPGDKAEVGRAKVQVSAAYLSVESLVELPKTKSTTQVPPASTKSKTP